jgi:hypothetical protein
MDWNDNQSRAPRFCNLLQNRPNDCSLSSIKEGTHLHRLICLFTNARDQGKSLKPKDIVSPQLLGTSRWLPKTSGTSNSMQRKPCRNPIYTKKARILFPGVSLNQSIPCRDNPSQSSIRGWTTEPTLQTQKEIFTQASHITRPTLVVEDLLHELVSKLDTKAIG